MHFSSPVEKKAKADETSSASSVKLAANDTSGPATHMNRRSERNGEIGVEGADGAQKARPETPSAMRQNRSNYVRRHHAKVRAHPRKTRNKHQRGLGQRCRM